MVSLASLSAQYCKKKKKIIIIIIKEGGIQLVIHTGHQQRHRQSFGQCSRGTTLLQASFSYMVHKMLILTVKKICTLLHFLKNYKDSKGKEIELAAR